MDAIMGKMTPPKGSFCVPQLMERYGFSEDKCRHFINDRVLAGKAERVGKFGGKLYFRLK